MKFVLKNIIIREKKMEKMPTNPARLEAKHLQWLFKQKKVKKKNSKYFSEKYDEISFLTNKKNKFV